MKMLSSESENYLVGAALCHTLNNLDAIILPANIQKNASLESLLKAEPDHGIFMTRLNEGSNIHSINNLQRIDGLPLFGQQFEEFGSNEENLTYVDRCRILPHDHQQLMAYVASYEPDYRLIYVSPAIAGLGFPMENWLAETDLRLRQVHQDDFDRVSQALQHSLSTGEKFNCHYRLYDSSGNTRWMHDQASIVLDDSGTHQLNSGVMLDITDKKQMKSQLHEYHYSLENQLQERTGQLMSRIALLESTNASLGAKIAQLLKALATQNETVSAQCPKAYTLATQEEWAQKLIALTRANWIAHGGYKPKNKIVYTRIPVPVTETKQVDSLSTWACNMIGWRVIAAGEIA